jgi:hypothetical protein
VVRSSDLTELGSSWYISIVPFGGLPANFSLTVTQRCQLPFGELVPIIHTVPSSVEGFYQLVPVRIDLPFELELSVPPVGSSALVTIHYQPDLYIPFSNPFLMSGQSNPPQSDPAVLAALNAVAAAAAATSAAVQASDENIINFATTQSEIQLGAPVFIVPNNVNRICKADPAAREYVISNNNANGSIKLRVAPLPDGTAYAAISSELGNPIPPGGNFVISDPTCRGEVYAVGSLANMLVTVVKSAKV